MAIKYDNVIIFGPTGQVGRVVALEASKQGAKVWLAMRDTEKDIAGLSKEEERSGSFHRVKADLNDPASVQTAIKESGAKAAYLYAILSEDSLRSTIFAMRDAGIEYIVFLSSSNVKAHNLRDITVQEDIIAFFHAQIEIALEDSGVNFTAIRPGFFASNPFLLNLDASSDLWKVTLMHSEGVFDYVSTVDVGKLSAAVLVNPPSNAQKEAIFIYGPQLLSQAETWEVVEKTAGHEVKITYLPGDEYEKYLIGRGAPPPFANYFVSQLLVAKGDERYPGEIYRLGLTTLEKYTDYKPQTFNEYVAARTTR